MTGRNDMSHAELSESYWPADNSEALRDLTLSGLLREVAAEVPDRIALVEAVPDPAKRRRWSYLQLLAEAERAARALLKHFALGDRIAFCAPNCAEWVLVQHGVSLAGMVLVPINPTFREREIETILSDSNAAGIFYTPEFRDNNIEATLHVLSARLPNLKRRIRIQDAASFFTDHDPANPLPETTPDQVLQIQFTSGTTGTPKGARLHHLGVVNSTRFVAKRAGFPDGGVWLNAMPMFHVGGAVVTAMATLNSRGTYVLAPAFEPALMLELIESEGANATLIVPTMILALLEHPDFRTRDHSSLRVILTGASTVPEGLVKRTKDAFGCGVTILFGQTELNGVVTQTSLDDTVEDQGQTLGRPLPRLEVRIADIGTGATQATGVSGEICVRGHQNMHGYCGSPEHTASAIDRDGWLHMGDLGTMDSRGYIRIAGRLKDMVIRGGMNIYPREIEEVLFAHPKVADASVLGIPDEKWGEIVAAVIRPVDPTAPPSPDELHAWCRERIAAHKTPAAWYLVSNYPMTASGKIQKFMLKQWIEEGRIQPALRKEAKKEVRVA
jgi:fatty-acyl-CoA synthase